MARLHTEPRMPMRPPLNRSCAGKLIYPTRDHARAVALTMTYFHGEDFTEYCCEPRGGYHVGHTYPLSRKRRAVA